jgi:hypothetical protein
MTQKVSPGLEGASPKPEFPKEGLRAYIAWKEVVGTAMNITRYMVYVKPLLPGSWDGTTLTLLAPDQEALDILLQYLRPQLDYAAEAIGIKVEFALPKAIFPKEGVRAFTAWKEAVRGVMSMEDYIVCVKPLLPGSWDGTTLTLLAPHQVILDNLLRLKAQSDRAAEAIGIKVGFSVQKEDMP